MLNWRRDYLKAAVTRKSTSRYSTVTKGEDVRCDVNLKSSETIFSAEKEFNLYHLKTREVCSCTGAKVDSGKGMYSTYGGMGQVMRIEETPFGMFSQVFVRPNCGGDSAVISEYFRKCSGKERIRVRKDIMVKIPPGVSKGSVLRVARESAAGPRGSLNPPSSKKLLVESTAVQIIRVIWSSDHTRKMQF